MHEFSVAKNIMEIVQRELAELSEPAGRVQRVYVRVGALSGIVKEALVFAYEVAVEGTPLEGSKLEVEDVSPRIYCSRCAQESVVENFSSFACLACGEPSALLRAGQELELKAIEVEK